MSREASSVLLPCRSILFCPEHFGETAAYIYVHIYIYIVSTSHNFEEESGRLVIWQVMK